MQWLTDSKQGHKRSQMQVTAFGRYQQKACKLSLRGYPERALLVMAVLSYSATKFSLSFITKGHSIGTGFRSIGQNITFVNGTASTHGLHALRLLPLTIDFVKNNEPEFDSIRPASAQQCGEKV
eukprot:scaffold182767_cov18-Tisochrysis_lutea.AAC.1